MSNVIQNDSSKWDLATVWFNFLANDMGDKLLLRFLHEMKVLIYNLTSEITMLTACVQV